MITAVGTAEEVLETPSHVCFLLLNTTTSRIVAVGPHTSSLLPLSTSNSVPSAYQAERIIETSFFPPVCQHETDVSYLLLVAALCLTASLERFSHFDNV
jgi:hypothetical protein